MLAVLKNYKELEKHVIYLLLAEFFLQFINSSFFLLINYYMTKEGYEDYMIADFVSYRFLAVMLFSFPLGFFIKGKKLKPFFLFASVAVPTLSLIIIYAIDMHIDVLLYVSLALWGVAFTTIQVTALPFVLLNAKRETHSEAIALFFQTWSISIFFCGLLNFLLNRFFPGVFDEKLLLQIFAIIGYAAIYFVRKIDIVEKPSTKPRFSQMLEDYDWHLIFRVLVPTLIIAIGAGFTIPFINLFFLNVHGIQADEFSLLSSATYVLVAIGVLYIPSIRRKFGYKVAITLIQSISVIVLALMATTEYYSHLWYAAGLAVAFFIIRQPLMNVAGPMTSELTMYYVGRRNQEIVSALNAAIWSGSWFISSQIFRVLRSSGLSYMKIFLITAALYIVGVAMYYFLIQDYAKRKERGLIEYS